MLYLARHGETDWNARSCIQGKTDTSLNAEGRRQAKALADEIRKRQIHPVAIYTSYLKRAQETAGIVGNIIGITPKVIPGIEEMNFGRWEGLSWNSVPVLYPEQYEEWIKNRRYVPTPNGESYQDVLDRLLPALLEISRKHEQSEAIVINHSANIRTLLSYINDTAFSQMAKLYHPRNAQLITFDETKLQNTGVSYE